MEVLCVGGVAALLNAVPDCLLLPPPPPPTPLAAVDDTRWAAAAAAAAAVGVVVETGRTAGDGVRGTIGDGVPRCDAADDRRDASTPAAGSALGC